MSELVPPDPLADFEIAGHAVPSGSRHRFEVQAARLPTGTWISLPVEVVHGTASGPVLWISAAVHGDEINGVEVIRRVLELVDADTLCGTLIAVPIVNAFGFIEQSRYLPDRRDLNRCFPGSSGGSLASRLADLFMTEIVRKCTHGIDLHTGSNHRTNLPQIRANLDDKATRHFATAFAAPIMMHSQVRDGSLRQAAASEGIPMLLFEGGEPLRFEEETISVATEGVLRAMTHLKMCTQEMLNHLAGDEPEPSIEVGNSSWVRARRSGVLRLHCSPGDVVRKKEPIGVIADAFGDEAKILKAPFDGMVIGLTNNPLVNQGDGVVHIARVLGDPEALRKPAAEAVASEEPTEVHASSDSAS